jgi:hypothetical protein
VGGTTAVLVGWRDSTVAVDLVVRSDDALLRVLPMLEESLRMNVELASPADFIPVPTGWEERSPVVARVGRVTFHHFDLYAQALAKVERGHAKDVADVREMVARGLVEPRRAREYYARIEPELYRFPAIDPPRRGGGVPSVTTARAWLDSASDRAVDCCEPYTGARITPTEG